MICTLVLKLMERDAVPKWKDMCPQVCNIVGVEIGTCYSKGRETAKGVICQSSPCPSSLKTCLRETILSPPPICSLIDNHSSDR